LDTWGVDFWFTRKEGEDSANTLDYMFVSKNLGRTMESFKVDYVNLPSDHSLLTVLIFNPLKRVRNRGQKKTQRRFKLEKLIPKSSKATEDAYENDHKEFWCLVKQLTPTGTKVSVVPVRDAAGELAKSEGAILDVWDVYQGYRF
jgi:hypothetical protein